MHSYEDIRENRIKSLKTEGRIPADMFKYFGKTITQKNYLKRAHTVNKLAVKIEELRKKHGIE